MNFYEKKAMKCFILPKSLEIRNIWDAPIQSLIQDGAQASKGIRRFILPVSECEFMFNTILDDMQSDPWPFPFDERTLRTTSSAVFVGLSILESLIQKGSRMIMFLGVAVTTGPGQIIGEKKTETLHSYLDMTKGNPNTKYILKATKFYETLAENASSASAVIDLFICSLDQVGLIEIKSLSEKTGGNIVMADNCMNAVFKKSFVKPFERDSFGQLKFGTSASINILCSKEVKIFGIIGNGSSQKKKSANVSDVNIGIGGTSAWFLGGVDINSTIAFFFKITNTAQVTTPVPIYLLFLTRYLHFSGHFRLRITTIKRETSVGEDIIQDFDQEAAAVLVSRYAVYRKMTGEETIDVLRCIDRWLIKLVARFGEHKRNDPTTFKLPKEFQLYPQFMYYLRRSQYMQTSSESPDESCYYRDMLLRETTGNAPLMIQPALLQYTPEASPVLLEMSSMKQNVTYLYDTFFNILIWHGEIVTKWRDAKYQPKFVNIKIKN